MPNETINYEPQNSRVAEIWRRLSPAAQENRWKQAVRRLELIQALDNKRENVTERGAVKQMNVDVDRATLRRWQERYRACGFDGLIDVRMGPRSLVDDAVRGAICTLRQADPNIAVSTIVAHVKRHHGVALGESTVKNVLRQKGLNRRRGVPAGTKREPKQQPLAYGGMKLVEAAIVETGYAAALSQGIADHVRHLPRPETIPEVDKSGRDANGRFLPEYNERYRKGPEDCIGPGFASVSEKRRTMDVDRLEIAHARQETIERKMIALMASPLIGGGRWDGMRMPRAGALLNEVSGHSYMPATLDRFTRELKYVGVGATLWEVHARFALDQSRQWGDGRRDAVIFVDGTTKPVWTRLFSQATHVSMVGRTMPGLEVVAFHSGYGTPMWMLTHSGRAPLVSVVPEAVERLDAICGASSVSRIVVIDAEGNSIPFLKGLEQGSAPRAWVTRLRDDWVAGKRIFNRCNYRPYRNGDSVRMGIADFNDPETKDGKFRMRVVEVKRRGSGKTTALGASMLLDVHDWKPADIADLYFDRWPNQEADFRAVNQAAGFKEVHGYGKKLVDNIGVVTQFDELTRKKAAALERFARQETKLKDLEKKVHEEKKQLGRRVRRQETVNRQLEIKLEVGKTVTPPVRRLADEQRRLGAEIAKSNEKMTSDQARCDKVKAQVDRTQNKLDGYEKQQEKLESRKKIFVHDVELDSLFNLLKVALVFLISYVLREFLGNAKMDASTFLDRLATLPARQQITPNFEIVTFAWNQRDPEVMALLEQFSQTINERGLRMRSGRKLKIQVDPAPPPLRPPPPGKNRCNSTCRFQR